MDQKIQLLVEPGIQDPKATYELNRGPQSEERQ